MIELCIFDMGGVLCRGFDIAPGAAAALGMPVAEFRRFAAPLMHPFMRGELAADEFWRRFEAASGRRAEEDYWATLFAPTLDGPTAELVLELRSRGARVVCGTNTIPIHYAMHQALGQYDCFDRVYASHLLGLAKPDGAFWLRILREEGVRADRAFFVDDYPENVEAAAELGIESRLYVSAAELRVQLAGVLGPRPVGPRPVGLKAVGK
jgi:HAD superfamily hydrolase (TIGR01509 family)